MKNDQTLKASVLQRVVSKYPLKMLHLQSVSMPTDARILKVEFEGMALRLWAIHTVVPEDARESQERKILIAGTGQSIEERFVDLEHLATVMDGGLVWHVFEVLA